MSIDAWQSVISPKVEGTWNLHKALLSENLDFFVLFSSASGLYGQWGQANYAAANTFLDAFAQYRHGQGLPASVLDIGPIYDIGFVSENIVLRNKLMSFNLYALYEQDLLDALHLMIIRSAPPRMSCPGNITNSGQVVIGLRSTQPILLPTNGTIWKRDPRMSLYHVLEEVSEVATTDTNKALKGFLQKVRLDPDLLDLETNISFLAREIGLQLFDFLMKPEEELDVNMPLKELGLDSLVAIEMRNWWKRNLGIDITVLEMVDGGSLLELAALAAKRLKAKFCPEAESDPSSESGPLLESSPLLESGGNAELTMNTP
jgi:aryl carrier-like protein